SDFILIAAMNPCPCGFFSDPTHECRCTGAIIQRYLSKVSGPLLDRIDLHIEVPAVPYKELRGKDNGVSSADMRARVEAARVIQQNRGSTMPIFPQTRYAAYARSTTRVSGRWRWRSERWG